MALLATWPRYCLLIQPVSPMGKIGRQVASNRIVITERNFLNSELYVLSIPSIKLTMAVPWNAKAGNFLYRFEGHKPNV